MPTASAVEHDWWKTAPNEAKKKKRKGAKGEFLPRKWVASVDKRGKNNSGGNYRKIPKCEELMLSHSTGSNFESPRTLCCLATRSHHQHFIRDSRAASFPVQRKRSRIGFWRPEARWLDIEIRTQMGIWETVWVLMKRPQRRSVNLLAWPPQFRTTKKNESRLAIATTVKRFLWKEKRKKDNFYYRSWSNSPRVSRGV